MAPPALSPAEEGEEAGCSAREEEAEEEEVCSGDSEANPTRRTSIRTCSAAPPLDRPPQRYLVNVFNSFLIVCEDRREILATIRTRTSKMAL